jgi:hypothetical protein
MRESPTYQVIEPEFVSMQIAERMFGISALTMRRIAAIDPTFPKLSRLSPRLALVNVAELRAWVAAQRDANPPAIRTAYDRLPPEKQHQPTARTAPSAAKRHPLPPPLPGEKRLGRPQGRKDSAGVNRRERAAA